MRIRALSILALLAGAGLLAYAVATGRAEVGLLVVVPFVVGSGPIALAGVGLLFVGLTGLLLSLARPRSVPRSRPLGEPARRDDEAADDVEAGGVIMIGPIPIVLGTDRRTALLAALAGILVLLGLIVVLLAT